MSTSFEQFIANLRTGNIVNIDRAEQLIRLMVERATDEKAKHHKKGYKNISAYANVCDEEIENILNIRIEVPDEDEEPSGD